MIVSVLFVLALASVGDASVLARRVEQSLEQRQTSQGGYALSNPASCPANYSMPCGPKDDLNQLCCPQGNTCFGEWVGYCCPTTQDCDSIVTAFPACIDPTANMYESAYGYFCCAQGLTAVAPHSDWPFCESSDVSVAVTLLATMIGQYGRTSATPFGGVATTPPGGVTATAGSNTTPTGTTSSPKATATSSDDIFGGLSTGAFIGIMIAGVVVFSIAMGIWRWCKAKVRKSLKERDHSYSAGPSMMPAYIPTNVPIYEPAPLRRYENNMYDPVLERPTAVSPISLPPMSPRRTSPARMTPAPITPIPMTPSPAYSAFDQHEMAEGRGQYDPIEVHGVGSTTGRVEMQ